MERRRKKRGETLVRKLETRVQVIFYLIVVEERIGRVSQQRETEAERARRSKANT